MRPAAPQGFGTAARRDFSHSAKPRPAAQPASPLRNTSSPAYQPVAGRASDGRLASDSTADVARLSKALNSFGQYGASIIATKGDDEYGGWRGDPLSASLDHSGYDPAHASGSPAALERGSDAPGHARGEPPARGPHAHEERWQSAERPRFAALSTPAAYTAHSPFAAPRGEDPARVRLDDDLLYEQARRDRLRGGGSGGGGGAHAAYASGLQDGYPASRSPLAHQRAPHAAIAARFEPSPGAWREAKPGGARDGRDPGMPSESLAALRSMVRSHEQPAAWLLERLGSGAAERAHEDAPLSARTGAAGARRRAVDSFEFELRGWFSEEEAAAMLGAAGTAGVAPEAVDRLEASLRRLLDGLALSAGSRARALQKLFLGAPRATATALSEGRAVSAAELGEALAALHVQWATAESARGLCARYAAAGPAGALDAASLVSGLFPETSAERARALLGRVREALAARGASGARTVQDTLRQFRLFDADGNGGVSRDEFKRGLALCLGGTALWPLGRADLELLFNAFDRNGDGRIAFEEFAHAAREPMTAQRIDLVLRAYERLCGLAGADPRGGLPLRAIGAAYDAAAHPRARDGRASAGRCLEAFLGGFDKDQDALVSAAEFVQYYTWHSWHLRGDDRAFERVLAESLRLGGLEGAARSALAHAQGATPPPLPAAWA